MIEKNSCVINQTQYGEKPLAGILDPHLLKRLDSLKNEEDINKDGYSRRVSEILGEVGYASRGLCISRPNDVVQFPSFLKPRFDWVYRHYRDVGLCPSKNVVWDDSLIASGEIVKDRPSLTPLLYMFGERAHAVFPDQKRLFATNLANSKNAFMCLAKGYGVSIPETHCFECKTKLPDLKKFTYPLYLKSDVSVAGYGVVRCKNGEELDSALAVVKADTAFQIQTEVSDVCRSVNVQYYANGEVQRLAVTEQILDQGTYHVGNKFPADVSPWETTDKIAVVLSELGVKGVFAFDVVIDKKGRGYVIECNPRFNGATTPTLVGQYLEADAWRSVTIKCVRDINSLDLGRFAYNKRAKSGAIVFTWGIENKYGILIIGSESEQIRIEDGLRAYMS